MSVTGWIKNELWRKYNLLLVPEVMYGKYTESMIAEHAHDLVVRYMEEHPGEHDVLLPKDGLRYFEVLRRAEQRYRNGNRVQDMRLAELSEVTVAR